MAGADDLPGLVAHLYLFQQRGFSPKSCRFPKPNCGAQANEQEALATSGEPELSGFLIQNVQTPKPFLLFCETPVNSLKSSNSADNYVIVLTYYRISDSLWDSMLLPFQPLAFHSLSSI